MATLIVESGRTTCSTCDGEANTADLYHTPGCDDTFRSILNRIGPAHDDAVAKMRPDLPLVQVPEIRSEHG